MGTRIYIKLYFGRDSPLLLVFMTSSCSLTSLVLLKREYRVCRILILEPCLVPMPCYYWNCSYFCTLHSFLRTANNIAHSANFSSLHNFGILVWDSWAFLAPALMMFAPRMFLPLIVCSCQWRLHLSPGETLNHLCIMLGSAALHVVCSTMITLQALSNWQLQ